MCKQERLAQAAENAAKSQDAPDKIKKLQDEVEKKGVDREMLKAKYEATITDITAYNPLYQQEMKQVFEKAQVWVLRWITCPNLIISEFITDVILQVTERKRQDFVKSTWNQYQKAIDTADSPKLKSIYKTLRNDIDSADPESDLQ